MNYAESASSFYNHLSSVHGFSSYSRTAVHTKQTRFVHSRSRLSDKQDSCEERLGGKERKKEEEKREKGLAYRAFEEPPSSNVPPSISTAYTKAFYSLSNTAARFLMMQTSIRLTPPPQK